MMHQKVESLVDLNDRPERNTVIQKDDIVSLTIDINLLSVEKFLEKYCSENPTECSTMRISCKKRKR